MLRFMRGRLRNKSQAPTFILLCLLLTPPRFSSAATLSQKMVIRIFLLLLVPLVIGLPTGYEYNEWDALEQGQSLDYEDLQEILASSDATPDYDISQATIHLQQSGRDDVPMIRGKRLIDETKMPRTHIKGDEYDYDVQAMILSLIHQHHIAKNAVYKFVSQGMKNHSIYDLDEFKKECIER